MKFATIALVGAAQAAKMRKDDDPFPPLHNPTPWDKDSLQACPEDESRNILDDGYTQKVKWPYVGSTCTLQISEDVTLIMLGEGDAPAAVGASGAPAPSVGGSKSEKVV